MLQILLHSSKTMRAAPDAPQPYQEPRLLAQAEELASYMAELGAAQIAQTMKLSDKKAAETKTLLKNWSVNPAQTRPALDAFIGDIYSGLQVQSLSPTDRAYANDHLLILSGLYGGLRALDSVAPYRLEMGYKLPDEPYRNLYTFWGDTIARLLPQDTSLVVNLSAVEYTKSLLPYLDMPIVAPKFLTVSAKTGEPTFVTVHAKIARGAFAHWLLVNQVQDAAALRNFDELGYRYDEANSTPDAPVFMCDKFGGLGLSVRLT
ncbi:MAG: YaaA family protein [Candidatus Saccharimonadales bacterium]